MGTLDFDMGSSTAESFTAEDTNSSKWSSEDRADQQDARDFGQLVGQLYEGKEADNLAGMLATQIDDDGHSLGDSRIFVQAVARAGRQFADILAKRDGRSGDGQRKLNFNMPGLDHAQKMALRSQAKACLEKELMTARAEYIRRTGRPLPGWW
jgi:hypothetical protein